MLKYLADKFYETALAAASMLFARSRQFRKYVLRRLLNKRGPNTYTTSSPVEEQREYDYFYVHGSIDGVDRLWSADAGGWVAQITPSQVASVVEAKARGEKLARSQCDVLWLVIVNDDFSGAAPAEISDEALGASYQGPFDRLIWLVPYSRRATDLRLSPPTVSNTSIGGT